VDQPRGLVAGVPPSPMGEPMPSSPSPSPSQRRLKAELMANARWAAASKEQRHANAARARANSPADLGYWERQIDPDGKLGPEERTRRATYAKKSYFAALALKSLKARAATAPGKNGGDGDVAA
jgi:hypothetical protein